VRWRAPDPETISPPDVTRDRCQHVGARIALAPARLLILCYHGVSLGDEHLWIRALHFSGSVSPQTGCSPQQPGQRSAARGSAGLPLRRVLATLARRDHVRRRSYDFYRQACPLLAEFGFPATVYVSTYYVDFNRPVYDTMVSYLLWKGRAAIGVAGDSGLAVRPPPNRWLKPLAPSAPMRRAGVLRSDKEFFWPSWRIGSAWITNGSANAVRLC